MLVLSGSAVIDFKYQGDYFHLGHRLRSGGLAGCILAGIVISWIVTSLFPLQTCRDSSLVELIGLVCYCNTPLPRNFSIRKLRWLSWEEMTSIPYAFLGAHWDVVIHVRPPQKGFRTVEFCCITDLRWLLLSLRCTRMKRTTAIFNIVTLRDLFPILKLLTNFLLLNPVTYFLPLSFVLGLFFCGSFGW